MDAICITLFFSIYIYFSYFKQFKRCLDLVKCLLASVRDDNEILWVIYTPNHACQWFFCPFRINHFCPAAFDGIFFLIGDYYVLAIIFIFFVVNYTRKTAAGEPEKKSNKKK